MMLTRSSLSLLALSLSYFYFQLSHGFTCITTPSSFVIGKSSTTASSSSIVFPFQSHPCSIRGVNQFPVKSCDDKQQGHKSVASLIRLTTTTTTTSTAATTTTLKATTRLFNSNTESSPSSDSSKDSSSVRGALRKLTGFSLTAFRVSINASISSVRATLRAATGISMTRVLSDFIGLFPLWARTIMQPFLFIYYAPLLIIRSMVGSSGQARKEARQAHERFVESLKEAVEVAEKVKEGDYWPVHVNENGGIELVPPPDPNDILGSADFVAAIADSVQLSASLSDNMNDN